MLSETAFIWLPIYLYPKNYLATNDTINFIPIFYFMRKWISVILTASILHLQSVRVQKGPYFI